MTNEFSLSVLVEFIDIDLLCHTQANENDEALPDPPLWRVVRASAPEWYLIVIGVLASAIDGTTFPVISVFMGRLFEVGIKVCQIL